jgi:hypothetical protein
MKSRRVVRTLGELVSRTRGVILNWVAPIYDWYCPRLGLGEAFRKETLRHAALLPGEKVSW